MGNSKEKEDESSKNVAIMWLSTHKGVVSSAVGTMLVGWMVYWARARLKEKGSEGNRGNGHN